MRTMNMHHNVKKSQESIDRKIDILTEWSTNGVPVKTDTDGCMLSKNGEPVFIKIPETLNKFLRWSDLSHGVKQTSQDALTNYLSEKREDGNFVPSLLRQVQQKLDAQKLDSSKSDLKSKLKESRILINSQNTDIARLMIENKILKENLIAANSEQGNVELAASIKLEALATELTLVKEQLSRLRKLRAVE